MTVQLAFCFVHVIGGYMNIAQITQVSIWDKKTYACSPQNSPTFAACQLTGDDTPEAFLRRVEEVCGGKKG